mmetsp:Transcript_22629/g.70173  ORF Transcript_22629/g.70173 Transcript_22629/m.70173 type:complete len:243 (-) Transcript_22629:252-980(-)
MAPRRELRDRDPHAPHVARRPVRLPTQPLWRHLQNRALLVRRCEIVAVGRKDSSTAEVDQLDRALAACQDVLRLNVAVQRADVGVQRLHPQQQLASDVRETCFVRDRGVAAERPGVQQLHVDHRFRLTDTDPVHSEQRRVRWQRCRGARLFESNHRESAGDRELRAHRGVPSCSQGQHFAREGRRRRRRVDSVHAAEGPLAEKHTDWAAGRRGRRGCAWNSRRKRCGILDYRSGRREKTRRE